MDGAEASAEARGHYTGQVSFKQILHNLYKNDIPPHLQPYPLSITDETGESVNSGRF